MTKQLAGVVFSALVLIIACVVAGMIYTRMSANNSQPTEQAAALIAVATATASPSPSPVPTIDYSSTYPEATKAQLLDEQADSAERLAQAESTKASAANTQIAATETGIANGQMPGTPTAIALQTIQAQKTQNVIETVESENRAAYFAGVAATTTATAEAGRREANTKSFFMYLCSSGLLAFVLIVAARGANWFFHRLEVKDWSDNVGANLPENAEQVSEVSATLPAYPGGLDVRLFSAFLSPGTLRKAARLVAAGVPLVHDNFTPIAKCMSEGQFTKLQNALVEYRAAEWNDDTHKAGITLTEKGVKFFADLQTTSPLNQYAPKTTPPALKRSIDDGFQPIG